MPTFQLETPTGKFEIDAADITGAQKAFDHAFGAQAQTPAEGESSALGDVAKSFGSGLVRGGVGLAALPGDIAEIGSNLLGVKNKVPLATSQMMLDRLKEDYGLDLHQPEGTAGEYAQTLGSFAPGMLFPGGAGAGLARKAMTNVVAPALGSETLGQLTQGSAAEPVARIAGALAGGLTGAKALASRPPPAPTGEQILAAGEKGYQSPDITGAIFNKSAVSDVSDSAQAALRAQRFNTTNADKTFSILEDLKTPVASSAAAPPPLPTGTITAAQYQKYLAATKAAAQPAEHTYEDFQAARTQLSRLAGNFNDPIEGAAASKAIAHLDNYLADIPQSHLAAGDASALGQALTTARADYATGKTLERVQTAQRNAELQAGSTHSGANIQNTTRQKLRAFLTTQKGQRGFTDAEQNELANVVLGSPTGNLLRYGANLLGGGGGVGQFATAMGGVYATGGNPLGLAAPLVGTAMRKGAEALQQRKVNQLLDMIKQRSPHYQQYLANLPPAERTADIARRVGLIGALAAKPQPRNSCHTGNIDIASLHDL